jgi:hypothetical protein
MNVRKYWWIGSAVLIIMALLARTSGHPTPVTAKDPSATPVVAWPDATTDLIWDFFEAHPRPLSSDALAKAGPATD